MAYCCFSSLNLILPTFTLSPPSPLFDSITSPPYRSSSLLILEPLTHVHSYLRAHATISNPVSTNERTLTSCGSRSHTSSTDQAVMARRYEIDELLWLRSSPLVAKPPGLPPIEEWMYVHEFSQPRPLRIPIASADLISPLYRPQPDPTTQTKQRNSRDSNNPSETTSNRRPSFFEARHISRGSNSGRSFA